MRHSRIFALVLAAFLPQSAIAVSAVQSVMFGTPGSALRSSTFSVTGGSNVTVWVTLSEAAFANVSVSLSSSNPSVAPVPQSLIVPGGSTEASTTITIARVTTASTVSIAATLGSSTMKATLSVNPSPGARLTPPAGGVVGGNAAQIRVDLSAPAGAGGYSATLASSKPDALIVPAGVTIAAGQQSATFSAATKWVTAQTPVTITIGEGTAAAFATVNVNPVTPRITLPSPQATGGSRVFGKYVLDAPAPSEGYSAPLTSSNSGVAAVPMTVMVAAGQTSSDIGIDTRWVTAPATVTFSTKEGGAPLASLTVNPPKVALTLPVNQVIGGTKPLAATLSYEAPVPAGGHTVSLASSNSSAATVPASITIPGGQKSAEFTVTTNWVTAQTPVTISAGQATASLTVNPAGVQITLASPEVAGGSPTPLSATLTADAPAPAGGYTAALTSSNTSVAQVPASATIAAGDSTTQFAITPKWVTAQTTVIISAGSASAPLKVRPPSRTLTLPVAAVIGGSNMLMGTATLEVPAPEGGYLVTFTSSNPNAAAVTSQATVAAGATTAEFAVTPKTVSADTAVTITSGAASTSLTVKPVVITLSLPSGEVPGGSSAVTGTVSLNTPAPAEGYSVTTRSGDIALATVPNTVMIPGGQSSAQFNVMPKWVTAPGTVTITAGSASASLVVRPINASVTLPAAEGFGGMGAIAGTMTLDAPSGSYRRIPIASDNAAVTISANEFAPGSSSVQVFLQTKTVHADTPVTLTYGEGALAKTLGFTVKAPVIQSVELTPELPASKEVGYARYLGLKVTMSSPVPMNFKLKTSVTPPEFSGEAPYSLPAEYPMMENFREWEASLTKLPVVTADTTVTVNVATEQGPTYTRTALVKAPVLKKADLSYAGVFATSLSVVGGKSVFLGLELDGPAPPSGAVIALTTSDDAVAQVPAVTIPAGQRHVSGMYPQIPTISVPVDVPVTISGSYGGVTKTLELMVKAVGLDSVRIRPSGPTTLTRVHPSQRLHAEIILNDTTANPLTASLTSSHPNLIPVPESLTVPPGGWQSTSFAFDIGWPAQNTPVTITATQGGNTRTTVVTVDAVVLSNMTISPQLVFGTSGAIGTVTLSGNAGPEGMVISLASNNAVVTVPQSVTVPHLQTTATFPITNTAVTANTTATITATEGSTTKTAPVYVRP